VLIGGKEVTVHLFCMRLAASLDFFVVAFPHELQEAFLEGHRLAFEFWNGVPAVISYDNLATAVRRILTGRDRVEEDNFGALRAHHLFDSQLLQPGPGQREGERREPGRICPAELPGTAA
jgi:transposase